MCIYVIHIYIYMHMYMYYSLSMYIYIYVQRERERDSERERERERERATGCRRSSAGLISFPLANITGPETGVPQFVTGRPKFGI